MKKSKTKPLEIKNPIRGSLHALKQAGKKVNIFTALKIGNYFPKK
jgi:hypothetical protein